MSEEAEMKATTEQTPADNPPTFAEYVIGTLQASIVEGLLSHTDATGGMTLSAIVSGTLAMTQFGIIMALRRPAEAALVAAALDYDLTGQAVDEVIAQATAAVVAQEKDGAGDGK